MYVLRGVPGSGKSTFGRTLGGVVCSADHYFEKTGEYKFDPRRLGDAHRECYERARAACEDKVEIVVIDNTNTTVAECKAYYDLGLKYGYAVTFVEVQGNYQNTHGVPAEKVESLRARLKANPIPAEWKAVVSVFSPFNPKEI